MSTDFIDTISDTDVSARETAFEALPAAPAGVERDMQSLHAASWKPYDEVVTVPTFTSSAAFRQDALSAQLRRLHGALASFTRGTVVLGFFDAALTETMDDVLNSRARSEESWLVDAVWPSRTQPARAWRTFEELARWIGIGKVRTATVLGISRGTTNAWKIGREPQPANARRLYRTHTIVKTLVRRLGLEETRGWLETGEPSPLDLLARGEFAAVDRAASALVFDGGAQESERVGAFMPEPGDDGTAEEHGLAEATPRRLRRRAPRRRAQ